MWERPDGRFKARLETRGRVSGRPHTVWLLGVMYKGAAYFSRHRPDGDWFQNALETPRVRIILDGLEYAGVASRVNDAVLCSRISELKYPGEERAGEKRVVLRVMPKHGGA